MKKLDKEIDLLVNEHANIEITRGGIRTHEAEARDLKPRPFDRSGTRVVLRIRVERMNFLPDRADAFP